MEQPEGRTPRTIEEKYGGQIVATATLYNPETQRKDGLIVLCSKTTKEIMLILGTNPIVFDTLSGKQTWIKGFGLLHNTNLILIDDGSTQSVGIHRYNGSRATLGFDSPYGTPETVCRILKSDISNVNNDTFLLTARLGSIYNMPEHGPE